MVEGSKAAEPWKRLVGWYEKAVFIAPQAVLRTPDIQKLNRHSKTVKPGLGDGLAKDQEQALVKAKADGAKVDADAWAFPNWKPQTDFTSEMY